MNGAINLFTSESYTLITLKLSQKEYFCTLSSFLLYYCYYLEEELWLCYTACGILVPQPGMNHAPLAVEVQSANHWTAREVPYFLFFKMPL